MDSKEPTVMASHIEDTLVKGDKTAEETDLALGLLLNDEERDLGLMKSAWKHKRIIFMSIAAFFGGASFGYDNVVNAATLSMPAFLMYFGEVSPVTHSLFVPSIWTALFSSMSGLCQALGGFFIGFIYERFGRKPSAIGSASLSMAGIAIQYTATTRGSLLAGKMVNCLALGGMMSTGSTYISEIAPVRLRGPMQSALVLFQALMLMTGLGIISTFLPDMSEGAFRKVFALQWVWSGVVLAMYPFLPESPVYLVKNNKLEKARRAMVKLYGADQNIDARLAYLQNTIENEGHSDGTNRISISDCFKGVDRRRTLTVIFVLFGQNACGVAFLSQAIYFLFLAGLSPTNVFNISIGGFALASLFIIGSWSWIEKFGRRTILLLGSSLTAVVLLVIGCLHYVPGQGAVWAIAILLNVLTSWQYFSVGSISWVIAAELSSYRLRGRTQSIGFGTQLLASCLFTFVTPYMYNTDAGNLGARTGFIWGAAAAIYFVASWFIVPETFGLSTQEMDWMFVKKVAVKDFQKRKAEASEAIAAEVQAKEIV
ncbi:hypothetical protein IFR05_009887 [Cadophora sp. M221]|nr:hypothetical protein IFR05_009887 [Cadophora sp. M221]